MESQKSQTQLSDYTTTAMLDACMCVYVCVRAHARVCVCVRVHALSCFSRVWLFVTPCVCVCMP